MVTYFKSSRRDQGISTLKAAAVTCTNCDYSYNEHGVNGECPDGVVERRREHFKQLSTLTPHKTRRIK